MEATVYVYDRNIDRLRELDIAFGGRADTCYASTLDIEQRLPEVDLVIGAVLVHGAKAPFVIRREQLSLMKRQAVLVDVSIDQGGCFETSRPTTHSDPVYEVDGVLHYCVANMPGAVPVTSTRALTNATLPVRPARRRRGRAQASRENPGLAKGVNVVGGKVTYQPVAEATGQPYAELFEALARSLYDAVVIGGGPQRPGGGRVSRAGGAVGARARAPRPRRRRRRVRAAVGGRRRAPVALLLPRLAAAAGAARAELGLTIELRRRSISSYSPRPDGTGLLVRTGEPPHSNWAAFDAMTGARRARRSSRR